MKRSVVLVDPETDRRARIVRSLDGTAFRIVATATDPDGALRSVRITSPDVALVSTTLGDGMGPRVTERLPKEYNVPVVLLASGSVNTASRRLAAQTGVMGFLVEPAPSITLQTTLEVAVCRYQELCALRQESEALRQSVEARKVIERAKGLLMEVARLSEREAYTRMRRKSKLLAGPSSGNALNGLNVTGGNGVEVWTVAGVKIEY